MTAVLVIEDDADLRRALGINLRARDYKVAMAESGATGLAMAEASPPDLVILDLGLPDMDGTDIISALRAWSRVPILVLSARSGQGDKIDALDAGADDYLTKPFGMGELLARLRAGLRRRVDGIDQPVVQAGSFTVNLAARRIQDGDGQEVHLTPIEWQVLEVLVRNEGRLVSQRELLQEVWGPGYLTETHYLRVYMGHLRRKLEADPANPRHLLTEPGMGYRFIRD
ncbi:MAG: two-component system, OmpR family, operon response regulator KdpE [Thermoleophilaceae bacterium]|jgi:two-component system KDP operon response regulator KdpE|nr:two-component system, OmpR family, operon response regulator KdpE [Thermoleophilaceae bacterium]